jgi:DNA-directed RNA polymerase subunit RPC12/RpoP
MGEIALPKELSGALVLKPKEHVKGCWAGHTDNSMFSEMTWQSHGDGFLVLTDRRLVWVGREGKKRCSPIFEAGFESIRGVTAVSGEFPYISITKESGSKTREVRFYVFQPGGKKRRVGLLGSREPYLDKKGMEDLKNMLANEVTLGLQAIEEEKRKSRIQYVIDFSFLKAEMEKGGVTVTTIKCPSCSAKLDVPSTGSMFKCKYCGNTIMAQDIFEKMKGFIKEL